MAQGLVVRNMMCVEEGAGGGRFGVGVVLGPLVRGTELGLEILSQLGLLLLGPQFLHLNNGKAERGRCLPWVMETGNARRLMKKLSLNLVSNNPELQGKELASHPVTSPSSALVSPSNSESALEAEDFRAAAGLRVGTAPDPWAQLDEQSKLHLSSHLPPREGALECAQPVQPYLASLRTSQERNVEREGGRQATLAHTVPCLLWPGVFAEPWREAGPGWL